jgi:hypothetical protein
MRFFAGMNWSEEPFNLTTALLLNSVLKIWIAIEAGQHLAEEQKMGTLELLLSTPLNERGILRGQILALKRQFLKPLLVVIGIELLFMIVLWRYSFLSSEQIAKQIIFGLAGIALLGLDLVALTGVALTTALTARTPNHAAAATILRVLFLPWALFAAVAAIANLWTSGGTDLNWKFFLNLWFWLGVVADAAFGLPAWWQLQTQFRELALRRWTITKESPDS